MKVIHYIVGNPPQSTFRPVGGSTLILSGKYSDLINNKSIIPNHPRVIPYGAYPSIGGGIHIINHVWEYQTGNFGRLTIINSMSAIGEGRVHGFSEYVFAETDNIATKAEPWQIITCVEHQTTWLDIEKFMSIPEREEVACEAERWNLDGNIDKPRFSYPVDETWKLVVLSHYWKEASIRAFSEDTPDTVHVNLGTFSDTDPIEDREKTIEQAKLFFADVMVKGLPKQVQNIASVSAGVDCADTVTLYTALEFDISLNMYEDETLLIDRPRELRAYRLTEAELEFMDKVSKGQVPAAVQDFFNRYKKLADHECDGTTEMNTPFMADYRVWYGLYCMNGIVEKGHDFIASAGLMKEHGNPKLVKDARACFTLMNQMHELLEKDHGFRRNLIAELLEPLETGILKYMNEEMDRDGAQPFMLKRNDMIEFHSWTLYSALDSQFELLKDLAVKDQKIATAPQFVRCYPAIPLRTEVADARNADIIMITEKAQEMFIRYLLAEQEKHRVSFSDKNKSHMDFFKKSIVEMHEYLEFDCPVNMNTTTEYIRRYLTYIVNAAVMPVKDEYDKEASWNDLQATITLKVNDTKYSLRKEDHLSGKFPEEMIHGLEALEHAQSFSIDIHADGNLRGFYYLVVDKETNEQLRTIDEESPWMGHGMSEYMRFIMRRENFTYKGILIYNTYNYDSEVYYIRDGKSYNIEDISSPNIVSEQDGSIWTGSSIILVVDFDFDAHPDIIEQLHEVVRSSVPQDQLSYIEDVWEEEEQGILLNGTDWKTNDLSIVRDFLNKINSILEPIAETCSYIIEHCWYNLDEFEVAYIQVINNKLRISGKRF